MSDVEQGPTPMELMQSRIEQLKEELASTKDSLDEAHIDIDILVLERDSYYVKWLDEWRERAETAETALRDILDALPLWVGPPSRQDIENLLGGIRLMAESALQKIDKETNDE